jgi:hypothetical protein
MQQDLSFTLPFDFLTGSNDFRRATAALPPYTPAISRHRICCVIGERGDLKSRARICVGVS